MAIKKPVFLKPKAKIVNKGENHFVITRHKEVVDSDGNRVFIPDEEAQVHYGARKIQLEKEHLNKLKEVISAPGYVADRVAEIDEQLAELEEIESLL